MRLGAFSISLSVKDLGDSKRFYEQLGFSAFGGDEAQNWLVMKNGDHLIGLFQGMFEGNMLTFNPGWNQNAENIDPYDDVRAIQTQLNSEGVEVIYEADENGKGPASIMLSDPDGNQILIDQHR